MLRAARSATSITRACQPTCNRAYKLRPQFDLRELHTSSKYLSMASSQASSAQEAGTATSVFLVTSPDTSTTRKIAESILTKKLAACVNIVPKITSLYWWDGKIQEGSEELMIIKSSVEHTAALEKEIKALHPYDTPQFVRLPITAGSKEYLDWIRESTNTSTSTS